MSAAGPPGDFINIEDLIYRSERKTHQKTYRNRNRHRRDEDTTLRPSSSPLKRFSNDDPAPLINVAAAEGQAKADSTAQQSRKRNVRQKVGCNDDDLDSVKHKAAQKRKRPGSAPEKVLTPVKSAERSKLSQGVRDHSNSNVDNIESQASRRPNKVPSAKEIRKRKSLSELRQTIILPARDGINVSEFKFPSTPTPQTPKASKFSDWTPGSGFDHIPIPITTDLGKRHRRVRRIDSLSGGGLKLASRSRSQAVGKEISGSHRRRDNDGVGPRVLDLDGFRESVTKSVHLPTDSQELANAPSADLVDGSEEQQPQHDPCPPEQAPHIDSTNDDGQIHQDPKLIGEALAEELNDSSSIHERDSQNATQASCGNIAANCTTEETNSHPAGCTTGVITKSTTCPSSLFSHFGYLQSSSSALQDVPTHGTSEPPQTEAPIDQLILPYRAYSNPLSSAVPEPERCETGRSDDDNSPEREDTAEATGSSQYICESSTSDEDVRGETLEDEETGEAEDEEEREDLALPRQSMASESDADIMLDEMEESKDLHHRDSRAQTQNLKRIPNAFDSELTWQGFSSVGNAPDCTPFSQDPQPHHLHTPPHNHPPNIETSSPTLHSSPPLQPKTLPTITLTSAAYFTKAVEQLSSPSKASQKLPSRKSHGRPTSHQVHDSEETKDEGVLQLGVSRGLKRKLSKLPFRPLLRTRKGREGEGEGEGEVG